MGKHLYGLEENRGFIKRVKFGVSGYVIRNFPRVFIRVIMIRDVALIFNTTREILFFNFF